MTMFFYAPSTPQTSYRAASPRSDLRLSVRLNGTSEFRGCKAGAGGALFARNDVLLTRKRLGFVQALNGGDIP